MKRLAPFSSGANLIFLHSNNGNRSGFKGFGFKGYELLI